MSSRCFLDMNIFVYWFDREDRRKQSRAEELVEAALVDHRGIISNQVIQEFLNVATRKFARKMTVARWNATRSAGASKTTRSVWFCKHALKVSRVACFRIKCCS